MTSADIVLLGAGGFAAGAVNAVAGGGTFFSFPALLAAGLPPVVANASNSVALWPGSLAGAWAYRQELTAYKRYLLPMGADFAAGRQRGRLLRRPRGAPHPGAVAAPHGDCRRRRADAVLFLQGAGLTRQHPCH